MALAGKEKLEEKKKNGEKVERLKCWITLQGGMFEDYLLISHDDNPQELAENFIQEHGLDKQRQEEIEGLIREN